MDVAPDTFGKGWKVGRLEGWQKRQNPFNMVSMMKLKLARTRTGWGSGLEVVSFVRYLSYPPYAQLPPHAHPLHPIPAFYLRCRSSLFYRFASLKARRIEGSRSRSSIVFQMWGIRQEWERGCHEGQLWAHLQGSSTENTGLKSSLQIASPILVGSKWITNKWVMTMIKMIYKDDHIDDIKDVKVDKDVKDDTDVILHHYG